jgi:hypothetical protein
MQSRAQARDTTLWWAHLLGELVGDQEAAHILALVALELDDMPQLRILHHVAVAAELCCTQCFTSKMRPRVMRTDNSQQMT